MSSRVLFLRFLKITLIYALECIHYIQLLRPTGIQCIRYPFITFIDLSFMFRSRIIIEFRNNNKPKISLLMIVQAKELYQKVNQQTESLRGLWVAKLNLRGRSAIASPEDLQLYENKRKEVCILFLSHDTAIFVPVDLN